METSTARPAPSPKKGAKRPRKPKTRGPKVTQEIRGEAIRFLQKALIHQPHISIDRNGLRRHVNDLLTQMAGQPFEVTSRTVDKWIAEARLQNSKLVDSPDDLKAVAMNQILMLFEVQKRALRLRRIRPNDPNKALEDDPAGLAIAANASRQILRTLGVDRSGPATQVIFAALAGGSGDDSGSGGGRVSLTHLLEALDKRGEAAQLPLTQAGDDVVDAEFEDVTDPENEAIVRREGYEGERVDFAARRAALGASGDVVKVSDEELKAADGENRDPEGKPPPSFEEVEGEEDGGGEYDLSDVTI